MSLPSNAHLPQGVVLVIRRADAHYLYVQRAPGESFPGYWGPVSGGVEPGESLEETAVREAMEEVGIVVRPIRQLRDTLLVVLQSKEARFSLLTTIFRLKTYR